MMLQDKGHWKSTSNTYTHTQTHTVTNRGSIRIPTLFLLRKLRAWATSEGRNQTRIVIEHVISIEVSKGSHVLAHTNSNYIQVSMYVNMHAKNLATIK